MFRDTITDWRARIGDDLLVRSPEEAPQPPASPATAKPVLSHETISAYLAALGLGNVDPVRERITCWASLQAFVATRIDARADTPPKNNTRLKVYGLEKSHVVTMFIRHVVS